MVSGAVAAPHLCAREVPLVILHTADVGGHVFSLPYREHRDHQGGLLRCATLVDRLRQSEPHVLLVDCGGLIHGSPESLLSHGRLPIQLARAMRYDARVPAVSEFRAGPAMVSDLEQVSRIPMLAANLRHDPALHTALPNHARWVTKELGGVRVVITGVASLPDPVGDDAWIPAASRKSVSEGLQEVLREVRPLRPDILVLLAHDAGPVDDELYGSPLRRTLREFPEFDVVLLGGGSRQVVRGAREAGRVVAQAGSRARWLGRVDILYDTVNRRILSMASDVIDIGPDIPESVDRIRERGADLGRIRRELAAIVGHADRDIGGSSSWPGQSPMQELLSRAIRRETQADVVLLRKSYRGMLSVGEIQYSDVLRAVPNIDRLAHFRIPAADLRRVLTENADRIASPEFLGAHGIRYTYLADAVDANTIRDLVLEDGRKPHGRRRLHIVCDASVLSPSRSGRDELRRIAYEPTSRLMLTDIDTYKTVIDYIRAHDPIDIRAVRCMTIHSDPD